MGALEDSVSVGAVGAAPYRPSAPPVIGAGPIFGGACEVVCGGGAFNETGPGVEFDPTVRVSAVLLLPQQVLFAGHI